VTGREQKKLCRNDLAAVVGARLQSAGGCEAVVKKQLPQLDSLNLTIESISVNGATATAKVKSTYSGKNRITTVALVKEGPRWKISGVQ
jgi:copper chaperone CopZ